MKTKLLLGLLIFWSISGFSQRFGEQQIISTETQKPYLAIPFDIDNDGFMDVLTASGETYELSWHRNLDGAGNFGSENVIDGTSASYLSVELVDIDSDGDNDILYLRNNPRQIVWVENLDGAGNFGAVQVLMEEDFIGTVNSIDMDNDGDLDLLATLTDTFTGWIVWYENIDGQGTFGPQTLLIDNPNEFAKIALEDIDNDGLLDILATEYVYSQGKIFWHKNLGNGSLGPMQIIYQFNWVQSGGTNIVDFQYADINTDGKKDVIITWIDDNSSNGTDWLENLDDLGNFGPRQFLMSDFGLYEFYDFDNDGDNDMLLWNSNGNFVTWKKNEDGLGTFSTRQNVSTQVDFPKDAAAADFNGDGWLDITTASIGDNKLAWYTNSTLGISENEVSNYQVFPNPTNGLLYIKSKQPILKVSVFNILGQLVETTSENNQVDLSKTESGIYFLQIENENGNFQTFKVLKD
jgi:hypothetical protein